MTTHAATKGLFSMVIAALAAGCGITVYVPGESDGTGGTTPTATVPETSSSSSSSSSTTGSPFPGCAVSCTVPSNGVDTCACVLVCSGTTNAEADCKPTIDLQGNHKVECACTIGTDFTGVCFEKHPENLCSFDLGCCGKYLGK